MFSFIELLISFNYIIDNKKGHNECVKDKNK